MNKSLVDEKIAAMQKGGMVLGKILNELLAFAQPGITLLEIEALAQQRIKEHGMKPSFSTVENYQWATCLCVNDVIVHGIPSSYVLTQGDMLTIDIGLIHKGYHTDTAWTKIVCGSLRSDRSSQFEVDRKINNFLEAGQKALVKAIEQARVGNRVGHISKTIQDIIEGSGYNVVKSLVGHGVGMTLHEAPQIPGYLKKGSIEKTPPLTRGMTIAIEVIYTMGDPSIHYHEDGWSIATLDHSLSAVFEHTLAVTEHGPLVLTKARI